MLPVFRRTLTNNELRRWLAPLAKHQQSHNFSHGRHFESFGKWPRGGAGVLSKSAPFLAHHRICGQHLKNNYWSAQLKILQIRRLSTNSKPAEKFISSSQISPDGDKSAPVDLQPQDEGDPKAQEAETSSHNLRDRIQVKSEEIRENLQDRRDDLKERLQEKSDHIKESIEQKRVALEKRAEGTQVEIGNTFFRRLFTYISKYRSILTTAFPDKLVRTYQIFSSGTKSLFSEMKIYRRVDHLLTNTSDKRKAYNCLSREELEVYVSLPHDLVKVAPVLIISAFPFAQNVVFPLALLFPRTFLSKHFWNSAQILEEMRYSISLRQKEFFPLLYHLKFYMTQLRNDDLFPKYRRLLNRIDPESRHPSPEAEDILRLSKLFSSDGCLHLSNLCRQHARSLARLHVLSFPGRILWPRRSLKTRAGLLLGMDRAMMKEGIENMDYSTLVRMAHLRGLDTRNGDKAELQLFLTSWCAISNQLTENESSLLLHLPLILAWKH